MWDIIEPVSAGIIGALINRYIIGKNIFESCMSKQEEEDDESVSISTTVSDASTIQHVHI
jgi:Na+/glutamate symporter